MILVNNIQDLQKHIRKIRRKIIKLKTSTLSKPDELRDLVKEEEKILQDIEQKTNEQKLNILLRKKLPKYTVNISYSNKQREKLKKEWEKTKKKNSKNKPLKISTNDARKILKKLKRRPSMKRTQILNQLKKFKKNVNKKSNKGRIKIKTSFEILRASSYRPQPINRQAARILGLRFKKK